MTSGVLLGGTNFPYLAADDLVAICGGADRVSQQGWPVLVALAGLPSLPRVLSEAKSYAERLFTKTDFCAWGSPAPAVAAYPALGFTLEKSSTPSTPECSATFRSLAEKRCAVGLNIEVPTTVRVQARWGRTAVSGAFANRQEASTSRSSGAGPSDVRRSRYWAPARH